MSTRYRAAMYRNEGQGIRLLIAYSEETESPVTAFQFADDLKLANPSRDFWVAVVSDVTCPHAFF